jgi:hypothetical protein
LPRRISENRAKRIEEVVLKDFCPLGARLGNLSDESHHARPSAQPGTVKAFAI